MNKLIPALALTAGSIMPAAFEAAPVHAEVKRMCVDAQGGAIDSSDPINIVGLQRAVGAAADGVFGPDTCNRTYDTLTQLGHISGKSSTLKIGPKVHGWLNVSLPTANNSLAQSTSNNENTSTPQAKTSTPEKTCKYVAIKAEETARLIGAVGLSRKDLCLRVFEFQTAHSLKTDGIVGPQTARKMITTSENPCSIYGGKTDDCFLGFQRDGNLGELYTIENGVITATMPARFGNPSRKNGDVTPEGRYKIFRSVEGERAGDNCPINPTTGKREVCMWNPVYFDGGKAIHGTRNPQDPNGSLGCIGVSIDNSAKIYDSYKRGVQEVVVLDTQRN